MRYSIATRGLPTLLVLMAIAVLLILSGSAGFGLTFGLIVAGMAGVVLMTMVFMDLAHRESRRRSRQTGMYRRTHARTY